MASDDDLSLSSSGSEGSEEIELVEDQPPEHPDTNENFFEDDGDHWLSEDHLHELQTARDSIMKVPPPLSSWTEGNPSVEAELTVA